MSGEWTRFTSKVRPLPCGGCWEWQGRLTTGYGRYWNGTREVMAHRWIYERTVGPIPDGFQIDHLCRNRACVNPAHMEAVTQAENIRRGQAADQWRRAQARKTHCPNGHPYSGENLYVTPKGHRDCRTCRQEADRRYRHAG